MYAVFKFALARQRLAPRRPAHDHADWLHAPPLLSRTHASDVQGPFSLLVFCRPSLARPVTPAPNSPPLLNLSRPPAAPY